MKQFFRAIKKSRKCGKRPLAAPARPVLETMERRVFLSSVAYSYVTDHSTYNLAAGQTATVKVYLQETLNGNTSIINSHGENGLLGAGLEVVSGTRPANPSKITAINYDAADFGGSPASHVNNSAVSNPNEADLLENIAITANTGVKPGNSGAPANDVYLGSLTIAAGSAAGTTTFKLGEYAVSGLTGGNTITNPDGYDLDISGSVKGTSYIGAGATVTTFSVVTAGAGSVITPHAATLKGQEGRAASGTVATFADSNKALLASNFAATIAWGDGATSAGTIVRTAAGAFTVTGSHAYAEEKPAGYAVKVSIHGSDGSTGVANSLAQIVDSPLDTPAGVTLDEKVNVSFVNARLGTFRDQDALNTKAANYVGTINWGDGTTSSATFALSHSTSNVGSYWIVEGSHKYTVKKTCKVSITLHDIGTPAVSLLLNSTIVVA